MKGKGLLSGLIGDTGHAIRTLLIGAVAAAIATYVYNNFLRAPVQSIQDAGRLHQELVQLQSDFSNHLTKEKEYREKKYNEIDVHFKQNDTDISQLKIDTSYLKGKTQAPR